MSKTETKHTPGPWRIIINRHPLDFTIAGSLPGDHYRLQVATVQGLKASEANAKLIAAAPELLAALVALFENCSMIHKYWGENCNSEQAQAAMEAGRAAISKATA